jgi:hypothetical protein
MRSHEYVLELDAKIKKCLQKPKKGLGRSPLEKKPDAQKFFGAIPYMS